MSDSFWFAPDSDFSFSWFVHCELLSLAALVRLLVHYSHMPPCPVSKSILRFADTANSEMIASRPQDDWINPVIANFKRQKPYLVCLHPIHAPSADEQLTHGGGHLVLRDVREQRA